MNTPKDISILYRKMQMSINALLASSGLSSAKSIFLFCLHDFQQMTQSELCKALDMDKSTVAKMLGRLEKDGMIIKEVNPGDVRSFVVRLTGKANELIPKAKAVQKEWLDHVTYNLDENEKRQFFALLDRVANNAVEICE